MTDSERKQPVEQRASWLRIVFATLTVLTLVALAVTVARLIPITNRYYTDADTIREPATTADTRDILWQPPKPLTEVINTEADDYEPRMSADGLTLYFVRGKAGGNADIYTSHRSAEGWSEPQPLAGVCSEFDDLGPEPSPDGESLYFYSDRPGGSGGYDLWVAHRGAMGWQQPINLGPMVNSEFNDYGPALTPDAQTLYFASNRPEPEAQSRADMPDPDAWPATIREDLYQRDYDLYTASITEAGVGRAEALVMLNTPYNDGAPAVSSFGDFLYFSSDRTGGHGGFDLYRTRRLQGTHAPPSNLGPSINTAGNELDPGLSLGGFALYFSSDRRVVDDVLTDAPATADASDEHGKAEYNLFYTTSREVFADAERVERAPIDWAAIWSAVGPNLLWALLALLLLLALLALLRDARGRRLSLLAKCLLASLTAHLLLMLLFNVWEVTATLAEQFRRRGPIQIALASPTAGDALAAQIRGQLTDVESPSAPTVTDQRQEPTLEVQAAASMAEMSVERRPVEFSEAAALDIRTAEASIERPVETPEPPEQLVDHSIRPTFDAALPDQPKRQQAAESNLLEQVQPRRTDTTVRAEAVNVAMHQSTKLAQMLPVTRPDMTSESAPDATSMAQPQAMREAAPSLDVASTVDLVPPTLDRPIAPDIQLPGLTAKRLPQATEQAPVVASNVLPTPRVEAPRAEPAAPVADGLRNIAPAATPAATPDTTFAQRPAARDAVTDQTWAASDSINLPSPDTARLELAELSLVALDVAPVSATETDETQLASPLARLDDTNVRQAPPSAEVARHPEATPATMAPVEVRRPSSDASLARSEVREDSMVEPDARAVDVSSASAVVAALPELSDLNLPGLEQATVDARPEHAPGVSPIKPQAVERAALSGDVVADASLPRETWLDVPTNLLRDLHEVERHPLAEMMPHEFDTKPLHDRSFAPDVSLLDIAIPDFDVPDIELPDELEPPTNAYAQRTAPDRMAIVERMGGSHETERAVAEALRWLAAHQSDDGRWDGDEFDRGCSVCGGETDVAVDHALTGLSLLAFLGAGHTHVSDGPYRDNVERGLRWLLEVQRDDGDLRGTETMYSHGIATIALSEAFGMTGDAQLADPVRRAVDFIDRARNRSEGGWRYDPGQAGDTSVLGWQVMALKSASMNRIPVSAGSYKAARRWMEIVDQSPTPGLYAYRPGRRHTPAMTAEGMFVQQLLGLPRDDPRMRVSAEYIAETPPDWQTQVNTYYWYYATLALFQHQGDVWREWNEALTSELIENQRKDGRASGSFDPEGEWADIGGRIYQTALCALMLEVYYRYLPLYSMDGPIEPIGAIRGLVTDAATGAGVPGAMVRLDLPDRSPITVTSGPDGNYVLLAPEVPEYFALSASHPGYVPSTANVATATVKGTTLSLDFELQPESFAYVAIERDPAVHHLGDDRYDGKINSQFQKKSEGSWYAAGFELSDRQLPPHVTTAEIHLLVKGVQRSHRIRINGTVIDDRLDDAPSDGSFGEFTAGFDPALLRAGKNEFEIIAKPSSSDIDDFEFVNVRILLSPAPES